MANKISPNTKEWRLRFLVLFMGISIGLSPLSYYKPKSENAEKKAELWETKYKVEKLKKDLLVIKNTIKNSSEENTIPEMKGVISQLVKPKHEL